MNTIQQSFENQLVKDKAIATALKEVQVYDNGGKTWDRYTIVIGEDVCSMSENAMSPGGFNQWWGEAKEFDSFEGRRIPVSQLSNEIVQAIVRRIES